MKINSYKKDNKTYYYFTAYLGLSSQGKRVNVTRRGFSTKTQAKDEYMRLKNEFDAEQYDKDSVKFEDVLDQWIKIFKTTVRGSTFINTNLQIKTHVLPFFKGRRMVDVDVSLCQDFALHCYNIGKCGHIYYMQGKRLFNFAYKNLGIIPKNPFDGVIVPKFIKSDLKPTYLTSDEINIFLDSIDDVLFYCLFRTMIHSGMRISECLALKKNDVDYEIGKIDINKTFTKSHDSKRVLGPVKNNKSRNIFIDDVTLDCLKNVSKFSDGDFIFENPETKTAFTYISVKLRFKKYIKLAGLSDDLTLHSLRHTHATQCLDAGLTIRDVAYRLGDTINMVENVYGHYTENREEYAMKMYEKYLKI